MSKPMRPHTVLNPSVRDLIPDVDPATVPLCDLINAEFPGLQTCSSCQGFIDGHRPGEPWHVGFGIDRRSRHIGRAVDSLELIVWMLNSDFAKCEAGRAVRIYVNSAPPMHNYRPLYFMIEGYEGSHPNRVAEAIQSYLEILRKGR